MRCPAKKIFFGLSLLVVCRQSNSQNVLKLGFSRGNIMNEVDTSLPLLLLSDDF